MLRIQNIKLNITHTQEELLAKIARSLKITEKEIKSYTIKKRSIDARKKEEIKYIYCIDVAVASEGKILKKARNVNVSQGQK